MAKLIGAQRMVLQAVLNAQGETTSYVFDVFFAMTTIKHVYNFYV